MRKTVLAAAALAATALSAADRPAPGTAKGTLVWEGKTIALTHAVAFVDKKDDRKPVILLLTDRAIPAEKWESEFDLMKYAQIDKKEFFGVGIWFDKSREDFRWQLYVGPESPGVSGYFNVKLDPAGKGLSGVVTTSASGKKPNRTLEATFATAK